MKPSLPRLIEKALLEKDGLDFVIGVDEAGRGPLAGPVVAGACVYLRDELINGVTDSKQISEEDREGVYDDLRKSAGLFWATAAVDHTRIDEINILQATFEAMTEAVLILLEKISTKFKNPKFHILIDGNKIPPKLKHLNCTALVKGDAREFVVAAASVFAKVTRDRIMLELDARFPIYGFKQHKGYPTAAHCAAISRSGPCPFHRMTFAPLKHMKKPPQNRRSARLAIRGA